MSEEQPDAAVTALTFAGKLRGNAQFLSDCHKDLDAAEVAVIVKALNDAADLIERMGGIRE